MFLRCQSYPKFQTFPRFIYCELKLLTRKPMTKQQWPRQTFFLSQLLHLLNVSTSHTGEWLHVNGQKLTNPRPTTNGCVQFSLHSNPTIVMTANHTTATFNECYLRDHILLFRDYLRGEVFFWEKFKWKIIQIPHCGCCCNYFREILWSWKTLLHMSLASVIGAP